MKKLFIIIINLILVVTLLVGCAKKTDETIKVNFVLDWTPNTNHAGIYVAKSLGYFEEVGLDVNIIQPSEGTAEQLVASGSADFGISYQENVTFARSEGVPIVSIAAIIQHNTSGFLSRADENINGVSDFENKKYGGWGGPIEEATIKYLMDQVGADYKKTEIITSGDIDFFTGSETGNIDYAWVFEGWANIQAKIKGVDVNYIDLGKEAKVFDYYTPIIITSEKNIKNGDITEKFMKAVIKGYTYCIENPKQAADLLIKAVPELPVELVTNSMMFLAKKYKDDAPYWGYQNDEVWSRYMDWLVENQFIDQAIKIEEAFTNDYVK
ncbi:MAG: ABC transporter substrate-binding protein [Clostridiales bacterium]|nr:ABC transporter substrate-binding protein [Clostridiales bacterium]